MMIYFADRDLNILGNASTQLPDGFRISQDQTVEEIDTGVNTFSCVISYTQDDRADLEPMVAEGNYILKQSARGDDDNAYDAVYQIIEVECDTNAQEYQVYAEDAGLDLLNTLCPAVSLSGNVWQMMNWFLPSNWTINLIDAPISTKTYTWDGESTCTERLLSVAGLWGCEIFYSFIIDRLQIKQRVVNVTKHRGNQEAIPQLRLNYDLKKIYWKRSIADLVTALNVTGGTPEGSETPINLVGYNYSYTDPETGDVYRVDTATGQMRNTTAMGRWSSAIDPDGLWVGSFQFDTTDQAVLAGEARAYLQRHSQVAVNYEVDFEKLPDDIQIGDRVNIIDEDGELYLEARLLRIETCEAEDTQTATIGEYLLRSGGISERVAQLASDLANARATDKVIQSQMQIITDTVDNMFTLEVDSDVVLAQAYLTARLLNGNKDIKTDYDPSWFKWILRSENGERLLGRGYTYTADMNIIGYASTILCRFIRPQLYDLTDHNNEAITDANLDPIQVSFAGIYNQPVVTRNLLKSKLKTLRATPTVEVGDPNLTREVNLYEKNGLYKSMADTVQYFWSEQTGEFAGAHITEMPQDDFKQDPENGGANLIIRSTNLGFRDGTRDMATFGADGQTFNNDYGEQVLTIGKLPYASYNGEKLNWVEYDNTAPFSMTLPWDVENNNADITYLDENRQTISDVGVTPTQDGRVITWTSAQCNVLAQKGVKYIYVSYVAVGRFPYFTLGSEGVGGIGRYSYREGENTIASGNTSHAEGESTESSGINSHAQNYRTLASGMHSHAEGFNTRASGTGSHAQGNQTIASAINSFAGGSHTIARGAVQTVLGRYNIAQGSDNWTYSDNVFIIGNGASESARSNAMAVTWTGNTTIAGTLTQSSDRRLKDHKAYLDEDAVEFINNLKPAHFFKDGQSHVGFYAQDVKEADKWSCMTGEMNGFMTLGYTEIIAPLVAYVQKLEKRIAELEKER